MLWNRRWVLIGLLALGQVGIIAVYHSLLGSSSASSAPQVALPSAPAGDPLVAPRPEPKPTATASPFPVGPAQPVVQIAGAPPDIVTLPPVPPPAPGATETSPAPPAYPATPQPPQLATNAPVDVPPLPATDKAMLPPVPGPGEPIPVVGPPASSPAPPLPPPPQEPTPGPAPLAPPSTEPPTPPIPPVPTGSAPPFAPPAPPNAQPAPPAPPSLPSAPLPDIAGSAPPPPVTPTPPVAVPQPATPPAAAAPVPPCPWTLRMAIVEGRTQLEARNGKEVQFSVSCQQLELQAPRGSIQAQGDVKISGSGLDGCCERLTINWWCDHVLLEGHAQLKCLREGQDVELKADKLSLKLSASSTVKGVGETAEPPTAEPVKDTDKGDEPKKP
jgi:hypothetical protein